jgi:hypothetical protein
VNRQQSYFEQAPNTKRRRNGVGVCWRREFLVDLWSRQARWRRWEAPQR